MAAAMSEHGRRLAAGAWIAVATGAICLLTAGGSMTSTDAVVAYDLTQSLVEHHSIAISHSILGKPAYQGIDGRYYSGFGLAQSIWNVPFYLAGRAAARHVRQPDAAAAIPKAVVTLGTIPAVALLAWCAFALLASLGVVDRRAAAAAILLVVATPLWPYSRFGFNQPLAALLLWAAVLCAVRARRDLVMAAAAGLVAGALILTRHEMFVAAGLLAVYVALDPPHLRRAAAFAAGFLPLAAAWGAYNWIRFGSPLQMGYLRDTSIGWSGSIATGTLGLLFSAYSSIFLYCPLVFLSGAGLAALWRRDRRTALLFMAIFAGLFFVYASVGVWQGGRAYGPRHLVPVLPALLLPIAFWQPASRTTRRVCAALVVLSCLIQVPGVLVDYSKVRVAQARAGETVAQDMRWSRAPVLMNARASLDLVPPALATLAGMRPVVRIPRGVSLNEAFTVAPAPDLWWYSLLCLGVIGRGTALAIAIALAVLAIGALAQIERLTRAASGVEAAA
jgi:hypothetical protein